MSKYFRNFSGLALYFLLGACCVLSLGWAGVTLAQSRLSVTSVVVEKTSATPRLTFAQPAVTLMIGDAVANPAFSDQPGSKGGISYRSSDEAIARVASDGRITAVAVGNATITATQAADLPAFETGAGSYQVTVVGPLSASAAFESRIWMVDEPVANVVPVTASGGAGKLRYAIAPALPAGLDFSAQTGVLSGGATAVFPLTAYTVTVSDSATPPRSVTATFSLGVEPALRVTVDRAVWVAQTGDPLDDTPVSAIGGIGKLSYAISPPLPAGLAMDAATGALTGNAAATAPQAAYTVTVTDGATPAHTATARFTLTINGVLTATVAAVAQTVTVGEVMDYRPVQASGGAGMLSYAVSPALPAGLAMDAASGAITGTATTAQAVKDYTVTVTDGGSPAHSAAASFKLAVNEGLSAQAVIRAQTVVAGDRVAMTPVTAAGGVAAWRFDISPSLPAGLAMDAASGAITGSAAEEVKETIYTVTVSDAASHTAAAAFALTVNPMMKTRVPNTSETHRVGDAVSYTPPITWGGVRPYRYTLDQALPAGLTMDEKTGAITGAATAASAYTTYIYTVSDSAIPAHSLTGSFSLLIESALTASTAINTLSVLAGDPVKDGAAPVTATGGLGSHHFGVTPGLPKGLTLNESNGVISGVLTEQPSSSLTTTYTVTVIDSANPVQTATATFDLNVKRGALINDLGERGPQVFSSPLNWTRNVSSVMERVFVISSGIGAITHTVTPPLPDGLSFTLTHQGAADTDGREEIALTGTPLAAAPMTDYAVTFTDSAEPPHAFTGVVRLAVIAPLTGSVAVADKTVNVGETVNYHPLMVSGGNLPYTYALDSSNALPPGLALDPQSGAITGVANAIQPETDYKIRVTDSGTPSSGEFVARITLKVDAVATLSATPVSATKLLWSDTTVNDIPVTVSGGIGPYRFSVQPALPGGLKLDESSGAIESISGAPIAVSPATEYTVKVIDANPVAPQSATAKFTLQVASRLVITSNSRLTTRDLNKPLLDYVPATASGGAGTLTYTVAPPLPDGLTMDPASGRISGTPVIEQLDNDPGRYTVTVTDSVTSESVSERFNLMVADPVAPTVLVPSKEYVVGDTVNYQPVQGDGASGRPLIYKMAGGGLPLGLTMNSSTGVITGTANEVMGENDFMVVISDPAVPFMLPRSAYFKLKIGPLLTLSFTSDTLIGPASGEADKVFDAFMTVSGGLGEVTITGALPSKAEFSKSGTDSRSPRTLTIHPSGLPTPSRVDTSIMVTDAAGHTVSKSFTISWP